MAARTCHQSGCAVGRRSAVAHTGLAAADVAIGDVAVGGVLAGHAEHALADDVALNLVASAAERHRLPPQRHLRGDARRRLLTLRPRRGGAAGDLEGDLATTD